MGLFQVRTIATKSRGRVISFGGQLLYDPDAGYDEISRRFLAHGYTPMLRREKGEDVILAMEGVVDASTGNPAVNLLLFAATILTTLYAGASHAGLDLWAAVLAQDINWIIDAALTGLPFAATLLGILGVHELGHYVAARLHGVQATLPYFIPMPVGGLGTLGAFISIKSPMKDRKVLFDIGLAGPIAGFVVALPLMIVGLLLSTEVVPSYLSNQQGLNALGSSILGDLIIDLFVDIPAGRTLVVHPIFFAAWLGFYLTGINLLPVGQLDGGHIIYALFGRFAHYIAIIAFIGLIVAGFFVSNNWFFWAFFILIGGLRHPPPLNDLADIGLTRKLIGLMTVILFVLILIPVPFARPFF